MKTESSIPLLEGINYSDNLPIEWEILSELPSQGEIQRNNNTNEELLQNLLLHDEASQDVEEIEKGAAQEHFKRLETKLDLLLSLVAEMIAERRRLPREHLLSLAASGLRVSTQADELTRLSDGDLLRLRIYLDPQIPRPFDICGHIVAVQASGFVLRFCQLEPHLQDLLDKWVFRHHRRAIASSRLSSHS